MITTERDLLRKYDVPGRVKKLVRLFTFIFLSAAHFVLTVAAIRASPAIH